MSLKELIKKIEKINKLNAELYFDKKYYLVVSEKYSKLIYIHNSKDLKSITDYYETKVANTILNDELIKEENYFYKVGEYDVRIGVC